MKRCAQCGTEYEDEALFCRADGTPLAAGADTKDPYVGQLLLGQFAVESVIGEGGMGTVYRAHQTGVDRKVALKVLRSEVASLPGIAQRFTREGRLASRIKSPHVAHVYLTGTLPDGNLVLAMELLEGKSLEDVLVDEGALAVTRALHILRQIAEAVGEAHDLGIVHRDLKPENVMLVRSGSEEEFVKVLDFGIAKQVLGAEGASLTGVGMTLGTPLYMSPEAAAGEEIGPAADVYALGVMLYRMLSGELPFTAENPTALLVRHLQEAPPLLSSHPRAANVPTELEKLVHRCLAKKPAERPADGQVLLAAIDEVAAAVAGAGMARTAPAADAVPRAKSGAAEVSGAGTSTASTVLKPKRARTWLAGAAFGAVAAIAIVAFWPRGQSAYDARVASLERRALAAYDTGDFDGPGGAIALTDLLLTLREDHPAALDLRRRMERQLVTEAREAEREGRLAVAIDKLELAIRLAPDDASLPERKERLERQLRAQPDGTAPTTPEPGPPPDVVAGSAARPVRVEVEPAVPSATAAVTLRAVIRGVDRDLETPRFRVAAGEKGLRFRAVTANATKAGASTWTAPFTFPLPGRYVVSFSGRVSGRAIDDALQVRVTAARPPPEPTPTPTPTTPDGGTTPTPEPPPPEPPPPAAPDGGATATPPDPPPTPEPPQPPTEPAPSSE